MSGTMNGGLGATESPRAPVTLSPTWPFVLLGLAVLGAGVASWGAVPAGVWHDDGVYMLVGKSLAEGHGLTYQGVVGGPPAPKFPPGYPTLLGVLWLVLPGIGAVTVAATFLNVGLLAVATGLFASALRARAGLSLRMSVVVAGLGFVCTDVVRVALIPLSESLYLCLSMGVLALASRQERDSRGGRGALLLGALLVGAVATRSAGVALVLASALGVARTAGLCRSLAVAGPALAFAAAWGAWAAARSREIPEGMRDILGPYGPWLMDQTVAAPGAFLAGLPGHANGLLSRMGALFLPGTSGWVLATLTVPVLLLASVGVVVLVRRFPVLGWYIVCYLGMLLLWPYLDRRLVVPIFPAFVAAVAAGALHLHGRIRQAGARRLLTVLGLLWAGAYVIVTASRIADGWPIAPYRLRAERLAASIQALERTAPADAVVGAAEFWPALHLHGGWTVSPSARFEPRSLNGTSPLWGTPEAQLELWRAAGIDHLLLEQAGTLHGAALDRLEEACPGSAFVLATMPPMILVRLEWSEGCREGLEGP